MRTSAVFILPPSVTGPVNPTSTRFWVINWFVSATSGPMSWSRVRPANCGARFGAAGAGAGATGAGAGATGATTGAGATWTASGAGAGATGASTGGAGTG